MATGASFVRLKAQVLSKVGCAARRPAPSHPGCCLLCQPKPASS